MCIYYQWVTDYAARLLRERGVIPFDTIHGMFCQWDVNYDLLDRPKSDLVCRAVARTFRWRMPRGCHIGWDFKPLPAGFVAPARMGLMKLAERVKGQVAWEKQADKIAIQAIVAPEIGQDYTRRRP